MKHDCLQLLKSIQIHFLVFKTVVLQLLFHEETLEKQDYTIFQNNLFEIWDLVPIDVITLRECVYLVSNEKIYLVLSNNKI